MSPSDYEDMGEEELRGDSTVPHKHNVSHLTPK